MGFNRCSYENFAAWANDKFDDMPSDDAAKLEQLVNAYKKTPKPRNLK